MKKMKQKVSGDNVHLIIYTLAYDKIYKFLPNRLDLII